MGIAIKKIITIQFLRLFNVLLVLFAVAGITLTFTIKPLSAVNFLILGLSLSVLLRTRKIKNEQVSLNDRQFYLLEITSGSLLVGLSCMLTKFYYF